MSAVDFDLCRCGRYRHEHGWPPKNGACRAYHAAHVEAREVVKSGKRCHCGAPRAKGYQVCPEHIPRATSKR